MDPMGLKSCCFADSNYHDNQTEAIQEQWRSDLREMADSWNEGLTAEERANWEIDMNVGSLPALKKAIECLGHCDDLVLQMHHISLDGRMGERIEWFQNLDGSGRSFNVDKLAALLEKQAEKIGKGGAGKRIRSIVLFACYISESDARKLLDKSGACYIYYSTGLSGFDLSSHHPYDNKEKETGEWTREFRPEQKITVEEKGKTYQLTRLDGTKPCCCDAPDDYPDDPAPKTGGH